MDFYVIYDASIKFTFPMRKLTCLYVDISVTVFLFFVLFCGTGHYINQTSICTNDIF